MAKNSIGFKLECEGADQFKKSLDQANQNLKTMKTELQAVTSAFDKNDKSEKNLTAQKEVLTKSIEEQKKKLDTCKQVLEAATKQYGENSSEVAKATQNYNKATAELNDMERQLKNNNEALQDNATNTEKASGSGISFGNVMKGVGAAVAAVAAAAVAAGKALVEMSAEGAAYADNVLTESTVTGIATDKLQEYMYAAELVDVSTETLTKSMAKQIKSMKSATDGSKTAVEAYQKLGVSVTDASGNMRDSDTVYWELIDSLGKVKNETERDALAMTLLGKSAQDLNPLIEAGASRMNELGKQARDAGYVLSDEALNAYGALDDNIQLLTVNAEAAKNALGTVLLPVLTELSGIGVDALAEFTKGMADANGDLSKMIPGVINILTSLSSAIIKMAPKLIESLIQGILDALPKLIPVAMQAILGVADTIVSMLPTIIEAGIQVIVALIKGIAEAAPTLIPTVVQAVLDVAATLLDNLDILIDATIQLVIGITDGIIASLPILIDRLPEIIEKVMAALNANLPKLVLAGIQIAVSLVSGFIKAIPQFWGKIPEIVTGIVKGFGDAWDRFKDIGANMIKGIWEGIKNTVEWLKNKVKEVLGGIVDGIKSFFGIQSPSKLFRDQIGKNLALGIGVGFTKEMQSVKKQMLGAMPTSADLTVGIAAAGSGGVNIVNNNTFNSATERDAATLIRTTNRSLGLIYGGAI